MEEEEKSKEVKEENKDIMQNVKKKTEEIMKTYTDKDLDTSDLDILGKLVDIHKDISNEEYWKRKEKIDMYGNSYGNYGRGSYGNYSGNYNDGYGRGGNYSRGSYNEYGDGSYGRRGRDSKYRGDDSLERMYEEYGRYNEGRQSYGAGSEEGNKSFHYMVKALEDFVRVLNEEAETPQQKQQLKQSLQSLMM